MMYRFAPANGELPGAKTGGRVEEVVVDVVELVAALTAAGTTPATTDIKVPEATNTFTRSLER